MATGKLPTFPWQKQAARNIVVYDKITSTKSSPTFRSSTTAFSTFLFATAKKQCPLNYVIHVQICATCPRMSPEGVLSGSSTPRTILAYQRIAASTNQPWFVFAEITELTFRLTSTQLR